MPHQQPLADYENVDLVIGRTRFGSVLSASEFYDAKDGIIEKHGRRFQLSLSAEQGAGCSFILYEIRRKGPHVLLATAAAHLRPPKPGGDEPALTGMDCLADAAQVLEASAALEEPSHEDLNVLLKGQWQAAVRLTGRLLMPWTSMLTKVCEAVACADSMPSERKAMSHKEAASLKFLQLQQQQQDLGKLSRTIADVMADVKLSVAFLAIPESGKSFVISHVIQRLQPPDLVQASGAGTPLSVQQAHEEREPSARHLEGCPLLVYDDAMQLPDLSEPSGDPDGLLLPNGTGCVQTGLPIECKPVVDGQAYVIELDVIAPQEARRKMQEAEEAVAVRRQTDDDEGRDEERAPAEALPSGRSELNLGDTLCTANAILGINGSDLLPEDRRVPGAFRSYAKLRWEVDARHPDASAWVNNALRLMTCEGHWGLLRAARLYFPCTPPAAGYPAFSIIDLPGPGQDEHPARSNLTEATLRQTDVAAVVVLDAGSRSMQGAITSTLKNVDIPGRMLESATNPTPVSVLVTRNVCVRTGKRRQSLANFLKEDVESGCQKLMPQLINQSRVPQAMRAAMHDRLIPARPLLLGDQVAQYIDESDPDADWEPYKLGRFIDRLKEVVRYAEDRTWRGRLQFDLPPLVAQLFTQANAIAKLSEVGLQLTLAGDPAGALARLLGKLGAPRLDAVERELRTVAPGAAAAPPPPPATAAGTSAGPAAAAVEAWAQCCRAVEEAGKARGHALCKALQQCSEQAVLDRISEAERSANKLAHPLCKPSSRKLPDALRQGPVAYPELPELLLGDLWDVATNAVMEEVLPLLSCCVRDMTRTAHEIVQKIVIQPAANAVDEDFGAVIMTCQQQFSMRVELGEQDVQLRLRGALEELRGSDTRDGVFTGTVCSPGRCVHRDGVFTEVMKAHFRKLFNAPGYLPRRNITKNAHRLGKLAGFAPEAAARVVKLLLERVEKVWREFQDQWVVRVTQALESQAELANGLLNADNDVARFPLFETWRSVRILCAEVLIALHEVDLLPGSATAAAAAAGPSSAAGASPAAEGPLLRAAREVRQLDMAIAVATKSCRDLTTKARSMQSQKLPPLHSEAQPPGTSQAPLDNGNPNDWTCAICECSALDSPDQPRAISKNCRRHIGPEVSAAVGAYDVCRMCRDHTCAYVNGRNDDRAPDAPPTPMDDEEMETMIQVIRSIRRPSINAKRKACGEPELAPLDRLAWPWSTGSRKRPKGQTTPGQGKRQKRTGCGT